MRKGRLSGKIVLIKEEVVLIKVVMEEDNLVVISLNRVKKGIENLNVNILKGGMKLIMSFFLKF